MTHLRPKHHPCGCVTIFDVDGWESRTIRQCVRHLRAPGQEAEHG